MTGDYFGYIFSAYALSALVLSALGLWLVVDSRQVSKRLALQERALVPRRRRNVAEKPAE
ncbi:heme exporter protein CcmD [Aureimonas fodinaquatilis]|uniref:Heme exporter protein D n=1 Tax=Aureimonas fodinaquatilis TaxID=2565783 RepID=A0A5B0DWY4_9HYPH|nr:heme exporter protein CcmD [Aureimonas fodinaquatilis]KAA0969719.1 heme exporter protein CcmD [Aureimonas fodinaquatilis]